MAIKPTPPSPTRDKVRATVPKLIDLTEAAGMSISGVRIAYDDDELGQQIMHFFTPHESWNRQCLAGALEGKNLAIGHQDFDAPPKRRPVLYLSGGRPVGAPALLLGQGE